MKSFKRNDTLKEIALISDIHGNSWALTEVIADIKRKGIQTIVNLGDSLYGPLDPKGTYQLLNENNVISISGNQDRSIIESMNKTSDLITMEYVKSQINEKIVLWLNTLPFDMIHDNNIYCCHASPQSDSTYLLEKLQPNYVSIKENHEIENLLSDIDQKIVLCGHSHIQRIINTENKIVINPGSVGLPAFDDDLPIPHKMENFCSHAKYSTVKIFSNNIKIEQVSLFYDYKAAVKAAEKNNRNDWAKWIKTGRI